MRGIGAFAGIAGCVFFQSNRAGVPEREVANEETEEIDSI